VQLTKKQEKKIEQVIAKHIKVLHEELGWFDEEALENTPRRIKNYYMELVETQDFNFTVFEVDEKTSKNMISLRDIKFYSLCSHHMLPFSGIAHVVYLPKQGGKVCGVSKLARMVKKHASKPQMQELMTTQIADELMEKLDAWFVMVVVSATHLCMTARGIKQHDSKMVTSAVRWDKETFTKEQMFGLKQEAMELIKNGG
jgi:GTP cyclohydrolase I